MEYRQPYSDKALLRQVAEGNEAAFTQLFMQWHPLLASYIFRITESRELTEEIVQDVFMKIWMTREVLNDIVNFKNYLLVISRNQARNALRSVMREKKRNNTWQQEQPLSTEAETNKANDFQFSIVDEAIQRLPPQQQKVYLLHRHEKLTYKQIASQLGISAETVKDHIRLAVAAISKHVRSSLPKTIVVLFSLLKNF